MQANRFVRPMRSGEIIRSGFAVWGKSPLKLSLINLPGIFARLILFGALIGSTLINQIVFDQAIRGQYGFLVNVIVTLLFSSSTLLILLGVTLLNYFPTLAMVFAASNVVLGRKVSIRRSFERTFSMPIFTKYVAFNTRIMLILSIAVFLLLLVLKLLLPGFVSYTEEDPLVNWWTTVLVYLVFITVMDLAAFLLLPVLALEKTDIPVTALRVRSFLKEYGWHIFWTYFISYWLPFTLTASPVLYFLFAIGEDAQTVFSELQALLCCLSLFYVFFVLFFSSISTVVMILSYYDVRSRKEKYNEEILAEEMGYMPMVEILTAV